MEVNVLSEHHHLGILGVVRRRGRGGGQPKRPHVHSLAFVASPPTTSSSSSSSSHGHFYALLFTPTITAQEATAVFS